MHYFFSNIWDIIGSCLVTLWVVELMHSEGWLITFLRTVVSFQQVFFTVMQSHSSHCFKCVKTVTISHKWCTLMRFSIKKSHCAFTVLTVMFLSTHLQVPFTNELRSCVFTTEESVIVYLTTSILSSSAKQIDFHCFYNWIFPY